jgi:hypothetical protein
MERAADIHGTISSWTTPIQGSDGFTSTLCLSLDSGVSFQLVVTTTLLEDHVWPTYAGQRVVATDVACESASSFARKGWSSSAFVHASQEENDFRLTSVFVDLPMNKITGFEHKPGGLLFVYLENENRDVVCIDPEKASELLKIGVGGIVSLFNVREYQKIHEREVIYYVERASGIRCFQIPRLPASPLSPPPLRLGLDKPPEKWICVSCGFRNFPSKSKCWKCEMSRKEGPLYEDSRHFKVEKLQPRPLFERLPQWMCAACRNRENFYFRDTCVRCGEKRVEKVKEKKTRGKKSKKRRKRKDNMVLK